MCIKKLFFGLSMAGFVLTACGQNPLGFEVMVNGLLEEKVDTVGSLTLYDLIEKTSPILLDARESQEYEVSHIANSINVGFENFDESLISSLNKSDTIIVYCSIGKRSEEIGKKLNAKGFKHVYNLYGGIFDWTNRSFPVVNHKGDSVEEVHPYNALWGIWVNNYKKVYGSE